MLNSLKKECSTCAVKIISMNSVPVTADGCWSEIQVRLYTVVKPWWNPSQVILYFCLNNTLNPSMLWQAAVYCVIVLCLTYMSNVGVHFQLIIVIFLNIICRKFLQTFILCYYGPWICIYSVLYQLEWCAGRSTCIAVLYDHRVYNV